MYLTRLSASIVTVAVLAGCSSGGRNDGTDNGATSCTVTLSGAVTGTSACTVSATFGRNIIGRSDFSILKSGNPGFTLGISADGELGKGTITESSSGVEQAITTASNGTLLWSQSTEDPAHGSVTVNLTSVSLGSDGYTFTVHGSADGTLPANQATNATGTVSIHVDF